MKLNCDFKGGGVGVANCRPFDFFNFAVVDFAERFPLELKSLKIALKWAPNHFI